MLKYQILTSPERNRYPGITQKGFIVESKVGVVGDTGKYYQTWVQLVLVPVYTINMFCIQLSYTVLFTDLSMYLLLDITIIIGRFVYNTNTGTS